MKKKIYKIVKTGNGRYIIRIFNSFTLVVKDIHPGYGARMTREVTFKDEKDCEKVIESLRLIQFSVYWANLCLMNIDYLHR